MSKERILVVEDEALVAAELQEDLQRMGYEVAGIVSSGDKVVETVASTKPDLVLMDVLLNGGVDGIDAAYQTQAEFNIPIIYLSAYSDEETLRRASVTMPAAYLIKPFNERELAANISLALSSVRSKASALDRLRGNEPLIDVLDVPALLLNSEGLIVYANRIALSYLKIHDPFFLKNESITRFVDIGLREKPDRPRLIVAADGTTSYAVVQIEPLNLSNGEQIGAMVIFRRMSDKERNFLETSTCALNDAIIANLPSVNAIGPGYRVGGFLLPCTSGTGDFYDIFPVGKTQHCFYALDVMGHGPLAALIVWLLRDLIRSLATEKNTADLKDFVSQLNTAYQERNFVSDSFFVSFIVGLIDRDTGHFRLVRAGHPPALHLKKAGDIQLLWGEGSVLGINSGITVEETEGTMERGDRLVLFSDGVMEAYTKGNDRMEVMIRRISTILKYPLEAFVDNLESEVRDHFSGDDASLLVLERA